MHINRQFLPAVWTAALLAAARCAPGAEVPEAGQDPPGVRVHTLNSPYQAGPTQIRVLLPQRIEPPQRYQTIYVLPVEPGRQSRYGDGLAEIARQALHKKYAAIFVAPTFSELPWYADHPTRNDLRQESHFLRVVIPFVEKTYPASHKPQDRLLLGFSKSGWGAWSLLLRHPEVFGQAAAWDAPLMMERLGKYGTGPIFGTQENFERYRLVDLLRANAEKLAHEPRLVLTGYGGFREHHQRMHGLLEELKMAVELLINRDRGK